MFGRREFLAGAAALGLAENAAAGVLSGGTADKAVDAFLKLQLFQGVVLIGKAGKPIYSRAIGFADIEAKRPATLDTPYAIASISKWLTTVGLLRLVEAGRLDLDAPITRYLSDYRADTGAKVTMRRLMSNTSGVPNGFIAALKADPTLLPSLVETPVSAAEGVKRWGMGDLAFEPGAQFDYSMTNWIIVVAVVEALTAKPFATAIADLVTTPLGLTHTGLADPSALAVAYRSVEPLVRHNEARVSLMAASGGFVSTAGDLLKAAHGVFDGDLLSPARKREMLTVIRSDQDYALGGRVKVRFDKAMPRVLAWETGRTGGYRSVLGHRLDDQTTVVLLNNTGLSQKVMDDLAFTLMGVV
ncbi:serine hydrolase domain-containing protein [Caulobacter sp. 1776]|uniref:serine hydrolase domain-containing protein n=1 Tax=Caulobacter sp. 1776 TaxID=3156420 RepID=UPI0033926DC7